MLTVVRSSVRAEIDSLSDERVNEIGARMYSTASEYSNQLEEIPETGVDIELNEGSLQIVAIIGATVGGLFAALVAYDSFWSGVERLRDHAQRIGSHLKRRSSKEATSAGGRIISASVTQGHLDRLNRLHSDVRLGRIDSDDATNEIIRMLRRAKEPIDEDLIAGIEETLGAQPKGLQRVTHLAERKLSRKPVERDHRIGVGAYQSILRPPQPRPVVRQRFKIHREPGENVPTVTLASPFMSDPSPARRTPSRSQNEPTNN